MLKRIKWRLVFKVFAWLICLSGTVVLMGFINGKQQGVKCNKIEILIPGANNFIETDEISAILKANQGDLIGRNLAGVNFNDIEKSIAANPYIAFVKVYAEMNGTVFVEVRQRQPILRIINAAGQDFYVDSEGLKIPISSNFTADVVVASGQIVEGFSGKLDTLSSSVAKDLYEMASLFKADKFWNAQIEQMFVNSKKEIELIPRVGIQHILVGNAQNLQTKMDNLAVFYKEMMPQVGWNTYKIINLMYKDQVVCVKNADTLEKKKTFFQLNADSLVQQKQAIDSAIQQSVKEEIVKVERKAIEKRKEANNKPIAKELNKIEQQKR